jgi:hypothetical protein
MRRHTIAVFLLVAAACAAHAQQRPPIDRVLITAGDGIGLTSGSSYIGGSNALVQIFSGSITAVLNPEQGIALTAVRIQTVAATHGSFRDPVYDNPVGNALILSYAALTQQRRGGAPGAVQVGGGVLRRQLPTASGSRQHDSWVGRLGFQSAPLWHPLRSLDFGLGGEMIVMPTGTGAMYATAFDAFIRIP